MTDGEPSENVGAFTAQPRQRWVAWWIAASARNPILVLTLCALLAGLGWLAVLRTPLDAIPDLAPPQVIVLGNWEGRSPELVESQITNPLTSALLATPGASYVRGQSYMGVSFVYVIFEDHVESSAARGKVHELLDEVRGALPPSASLSLGPDASGVGWIYQYALVDRSGRRDLGELTSLQDWEIKDALSSVPGVAEVATVGGVTRGYQVEVDPLRLHEYGLGIDQLAAAIRASNIDAGGGVLERGGQEHVLRGRGYLRGIEDLSNVPLTRARDGSFVRLRDVATLSLGPQPRRGLADLDGMGEVVGGIVVMRPGQNALTVIEGVKDRIRQVRPGLPEGVELVPVYDRSELIVASVDTLRTTLLEELAVVCLVVIVFLLHVRSSLAVLLTVPTAILGAFIPLVATGVHANIMSLGGIAVAIGAMVDGSIIIVENAHRRLEEWSSSGREGSRVAVVIQAMQEVGPSIFMSLLVIVVSFIPVFGLEATEGRLFRPLALTKTWVMCVGAALSVTLTPALVVLLLRGKGGRPRSSVGGILHRVSEVYGRVVRWCVRKRWAVVLTACGVFAGTVPVLTSLDREFMPPLNEGSLLYMPSAPPGMSVSEAGSVLQVMDRAVAEMPEVRRVFGKIGRARTATDPAPMSMAEVTILLESRERWRPGMTWDDLVDALDERLQVPGMPNLWWMPIQTRTEMLATGIRSPLAIQISGSNPVGLERAGQDLEALLRDIPGTRSVVAERASGGEFIDVILDRPAAALHGVRAADVEQVMNLALAGVPVTQTVEGRRRFPVTVRYQRELRDDFDELERVLVPTLAGGLVPLREVAKIERRSGPSMIRSEDGKLISFVFIDPGDRPVDAWVHEASTRLESRWHPPDGVFVQWRGAFEDMRRAEARLLLLVPLTLVLIAMLLYWNTRSAVKTLMVLLAVPFSLIGAVWIIKILGFSLSVAVWVGMIALAGLDAETGVVMLLYLDQAVDRVPDGGDSSAMEDAIVDGASGRLRPKLMTVICLAGGLSPLLWSVGTGADVMQRIAAPMVGGLLTSFLLELTVLPAVYAIWKYRAVRPRTPSK